MITDCGIEIDAAPSLVWNVFSDVERWPEWTASVTSLTALDGPGLAVGKRFEIKQPRLPKLVWEVTALDEGTSWTWEQRSPGGRTIAVPRGHPDGDRTQVRQRLDQQGPIGALVGEVHARHHEALSRARGAGPQGAQRATAWLDHLTSSGARQLLDALIEAFAEGGIGDRSLREVAEAVGTSHRMLLHHFRSRDELLLTIVEEVERRQMRVLPSPSTEPADGCRDVGRLRGPNCARSSDCSSSATRAGRRARSRSPGWCPARSTAGWPRWTQSTGGTADPALVRLGLAVTRGLLLDLVATDDDDGVDAAAQAFVDLLRAAQTSAASLPASRST